MPPHDRSASRPAPCGGIDSRFLVCDFVTRIDMMLRFLCRARLACGPLSREELQLIHQQEGMMGTWMNPGRFDCSRRALIDEPQFTLLARSPEFRRVVRFFATLREEKVDCGEAPASDFDLIQEAREIAERGADWRCANPGRWHTEQAAFPSDDQVLDRLRARARRDALAERSPRTSRAVKKGGGSP